jgi:hypothetical protein
VARRARHWEELLLAFETAASHDSKNNRRRARRGAVCGQIAFVLLIVLSNAPSPFAQDCGLLKPNKSLDTEVSNDTKVNASALFKTLGAADFENKFNKAQKDTLSKYPNADRIEIAEYHIYFLCTFLKSTTTLSEHEKVHLIFQHRQAAPACHSRQKPPRVKHSWWFSLLRLFDSLKRGCEAYTDVWMFKHLDI